LGARIARESKAERKGQKDAMAQSLGVKALKKSKFLRAFASFLSVFLTHDQTTPH
jgi:hypothetical protein